MTMTMMKTLTTLLLATSITAFQIAPASHSSTRTRTAATTTTLLSATATDETEVVNPRLEGLALQLDDGTRKSHSMAENTAFVSGFFKGLSTRTSYRALLTSYYFVYQAMEDSFTSDKAPDAVKTMDDAELRRMASLEKDMEYFYGPNWKDELTMSAGTKTYVDRIHQLANDEDLSYLLVAHQYTRYLGDLFGGQMMSGMASRSLELEDERGVDFYNFEGITSVKDFITVWYTKLNALDLTEEQKEKIVDEANFVFDLNIGILEELDGNPLKAMWTLAVNSLKIQLGLAK